MICQKSLMAEWQKLLLKFSDKLFKDLSTVTTPSPICGLHNNDLYCTNYGLTKDTKDTEINVFTCLQLKPCVSTSEDSEQL
jgi:hypothetical protein